MYLHKKSQIFHMQQNINKIRKSYGFKIIPKIQLDPDENKWVAKAKHFRKQHKQNAVFNDDKLSYKNIFNFITFLFGFSWL